MYICTKKSNLIIDLILLFINDRRKEIRTTWYKKLNNYSKKQDIRNYSVFGYLLHIIRINCTVNAYVYMYNVYIQVSIYVSMILWSYLLLRRVFGRRFENSLHRRKPAASFLSHCRPIWQPPIIHNDIHINEILRSNWHIYMYTYKKYIRIRDAYTIWREITRIKPRNDLRIVLRLLSTLDWYCWIICHWNTR